MDAEAETGYSEPGAEERPAIVIMGVAGCGKSAVGSALAAALGSTFIEGDRLHPPENVARMARGKPLTDELRAGWLDAVGRSVCAAVTEGRGCVAACSALKRIYRDRLRRLAPSTLFIHLAIGKEEARRRVANRGGHFMPASLIDSQFATLEPLQADEEGLALDAERPVTEVVSAALAFIAASRRSNRAE